MEDRTPIYMLIIVGIVAVVGIIIMMTSTATPVSNGSMITGDVIIDNTPSFNAFGKVFFAVFLFGVAGYMYFSKHE